MTDRIVASEATFDELEASATFETFYHAEARTLFRRLWLVTGNRAEAEELMQDAFLNVWERWDRVGSMDDPRGYLYRTAMNLFRKRYRRTMLAVRRTVGLVASNDDFSDADDRQVVRHVLATLPPRQRAALVLTEMLGFTSKEAADALGVTDATIRSWGMDEVVAISPDGEVLYSSLPPLTDTERVGTVRAFGATWAVKLSTAADGYWGTPCVEPAATSTLEPCERAWGGGSLVQTFESPVPAVFVTDLIGVAAVDVVTDDGRRYPAEMVGSLGGGASVAVVPLEGSGDGRFVYTMTDGSVEEGGLSLEWSDVGQVIGEIRSTGS